MTTFSIWFPCQSEEQVQVVGSSGRAQLSRSGVLKRVAGCGRRFYIGIPELKEWAKVKPGRRTKVHKAGTGRRKMTIQERQDVSELRVRSLGDESKVGRYGSLE